MATIKFKDASPYTRGPPTPPMQDYLYKKYMEDLSCKTSREGNRVIGVALFGVGRAGTIHLSSISTSKRVKLIYIVEDDESKWASIRKYWNLEGVTFLTSKQADKVYKDCKIDAVVIASPTYTHEEIVTKALLAGKGVFCEKPIAEDRPSTAKCYDVAKQEGKPLFCAFNRRFDPSYAAVRDKVRRGQVGHVHMIKTVARDSPLPTIEYLKKSGGIFHDCMVHDIDMVTWVLGEYPTKVSVQAQANIPEIKAIDDFDTVAATFYFPSGTLAMIDLSRNSSYGYDQRLEVFGPKGMVDAANEQPIHSLTSQSALNGLNSAPIWYSFASRFRNGYLREFDHFIDVVLGSSDSSVRSKETLAVSRIAAACEESARTGKMVEIKWGQGELPSPSD